MGWGMEGAATTGEMGAEGSAAAEAKEAED